jgi:hypothetical protein
MLITKTYLPAKSLPVAPNSPIKKVVPPVDVDRRKLGSCGSEEIERDLQPVRRAFRRYRRAKDRWAVYRYLKRVYSLVCAWKVDKRSEARARHLLEMQCRPGMMSTEPFSVVIFASADGRVDPRHRSKWSRALQFAGRKMVPPGRLVRFLRKRGGLNRCAASLGKASRRSW